ncbi:4Fe-4S binding protein [Methanobacterium alkalithermotolerans]|uniref:4Fe-4S binding protein n=1 Tax=Methanobacterium alkalithermotolerans TaxID=2731220 RepID=A0A8T8KDW2_9EURY|nr:4Fe-4S binding protein [Methanobacterium alkalithermotolerans]QUH23541.1 4Fe-4S binding protein [Methanobacterium alkalithermotolerans]
MPKHIVSGLKYMATVKLRKKGQTQREIAQALGMDRSTVSHYLNGRNLSKDSIEVAKLVVNMCPKDFLLFTHTLLKDKDRTRIIIQTCQKNRYEGKVKNSCIGCGLCVDTCLMKAVVLNDLKAQIDFEWCCGCLICVEMCPTNSIEIKEVVD